MPAFQGSKLHISAEISWYKIGELQFYSDENDPPQVVVKKPKKRKPTKPRQKESQGQFEQRLREWEAEKEAQQPHDPEIKPKGNSMTQTYYTKRLLPIYIRSCQQALDTGDIAVTTARKPGIPSFKRTTLQNYQAIKLDITDSSDSQSAFCNRT